MEKRTKYIFCINTGRSGSAYLTKLFSHVQGCCSFHEPQPICNGEAMRQYLGGKPELMRALTKQKVENIQRTLDDLQPNDAQLYVETNNCFIKGFGWFIPEYFSEDQIGIVVLKRDRTKIAKSWFRITCSPLLKFGLDWLIVPDIKNPLIEPPKRFLSPKITYWLFRFFRTFFRGKRFYKYLSLPVLKTPKWIADYELECLKWYVDETSARGNLYQEQFKEIKYYEVSVDQLNSSDEIKRLLDYFGLTAKKSMSDVIGEPANLMPWHAPHNPVVGSDSIRVKQAL